MNDLADLFRALEDDAGAALGSAVVFEGAAAAARAHRRNRRTRRIGASTVAVVVTIAVVAAAVGRDDKNPNNAHVHVNTRPPTPTTPTVPVADLIAGHWELIPPAPVASGGASVWTGSRLIVWGGASGRDNDILSNKGAAYDPTTRTWERLPAAPLFPRSNFASVWTGTEMLVWGGAVNAQTGAATNDGAAYNPRTHTWRRLSRSPLRADVNTIAVWTGDRALFFTTGNGSVAAYNPRTDRWTDITPHFTYPNDQWFHAVARGNGRDVLGWFGWRTDSGGGLGDGVQLYAYDAARNRWRVIPPGSSDPNAIGAPRVTFWTDQGLLVRGQGGRACWICHGPPPGPERTSYFDPATNTWTALATDPFASLPYGVSDLTSVWTGNALVSLNGHTQIKGAQLDIEPGDASLYDASAKTWSKLPRAPGGCDSEPDAPIWTGHEVLVYCNVSAPDGTHRLSAAGLAFIPRVSNTTTQVACPALDGYTLQRGLPSGLIGRPDNQRFLGAALSRALAEVTDAPVCRIDFREKSIHPGGTAYDVGLAARPYSGPLRLGGDQVANSLPGTAHGIVELKLFADPSGRIVSIELGTENTRAMFTAN